MLSARLSATEMVFQVYGKSLHPEFFETQSQRTIEHENYRAQLHITSTGHFISWKSKTAAICEVATAASHELSEVSRYLNYRVKGEHSGKVEGIEGVKYSVCLSLEQMDTEVFWTAQEELVRDPKEGMLFSFQSPSRLTPGAVSYLGIESKAKKLFVQSIHTFPASFSIVRSQSLFELA